VQDSINVTLSLADHQIINVVVVKTIFLAFDEFVVKLQLFIYITDQCKQFIKCILVFRVNWANITLCM
jgi:hypothetical protein